MNSEKLLNLVKQWNKLEAEQKDLDFRKAQWAREARGCFQDDRRFITWCKSDIGLTDAKAQDLCLLARAGGVVTDPKVWIKLGGSREIRAVEPLTKREQVAVLEAAKTSGRAVRTIAKERHPELFSAVPKNDVTPLKKRQMSDIETLARFIADHAHRLPKLPGDVAVIVRMYAPAVKSAA